MIRSCAVIDSPLGPLLAVARDGALAELWMSPLPQHETAGPDDPRDRALLDRVAGQLSEYFAGTLTRFDLPLNLDGTPFQRRVWEELVRIPFGETTSYGELARRVGRPGSARAVGAANGQNPVSIIVPCHRVIGSSGRLTGYGGGLHRKAWLLDHEAGHGPGQLALAPAPLLAER
jgi:methylated-DNA-[protein]-cysteine S-methyltransferase